MAQSCGRGDRASAAEHARNDGLATTVLGIIGVQRRFDEHRDRGSSVSECNLRSPPSTSRWTTIGMDYVFVWVVKGVV